MDTKLLLIKSITLLYRESQIKPLTMNSAKLVDDILTVIKPPESFTTGDFGKDPLVALRETARWMSQNPVSYTYDKTELFQRLRANCGNDDSLFESLMAGMDFELGEDSVKRTAHEIRSGLNIFMNQTRIKEVMRKHANRLTFQANTVDWPHFRQELLADLEPYLDMETLGKKNKHNVTRVNFDDYGSVQSAFMRSKDELDTRGVFKMGLQGLNRMFGPHGGLRRGESLLTSALKFNYKSGLCLDMFRWAAVYNTPMLLDPERKPLLLRMSLENSVEQDIMALYKSLAENELKLPVDVTAVTAEEATRYVIEQMQRTGFKVEMRREDPTEMTIFDLQEMIEEYEADGYEIQLANIDYLNCISKKGCAQGPAGVDIKDLYRRARNLFNIRKTTFITPHQMSTDAKMLLRTGQSAGDFVKEVVDRGYYEGCKGLDTEPDLEIHQHIVKVNGESYLTFQRGKHRKVGETNPHDLYFVYKFNEWGPIPDDVHGADMSRRAVGGGTQSEGGMAAWWDGV